MRSIHNFTLDSRAILSTADRKKRAQLHNGRSYFWSGARKIEEERNFLNAFQQKYQSRKK